MTCFTAPIVSVIIPTYNRADYLKKTITSVLDQTFTDLEVIVVDDGSSDNSSEIVAGFADPRLIYIFQHNQGKGAAINRGFSVSRGKYIGKLDSDDWYLPNCLNDLLLPLEDDIELGVSGGGYYLVNNDDQIIDEMQFWINYPILDISTWLVACPILWQGALIRREWFNCVGGIDPKIIVGDDWDFGIRLASAGCEMAWVKKPVFSYRLHEGTAKNYVEKRADDTFYILEKYFSQPDLSPNSNEIRREIFTKAHLNLAGVEYAAGQFPEAKTHLEWAINTDPSLLDDNGKKIFHVVAWWAQSPVMTFYPEKYLSTIMANLPDSAQHLKNFYRKALAEYYCVRIFQSSQKSNWEQVRNFFLKLLFASPSSLIDRGIISVCLEAFLGSRKTNLIKYIYKQLA